MTQPGYSPRPGFQAPPGNYPPRPNPWQGTWQAPGQGWGPPQRPAPQQAGWQAPPPWGAPPQQAPQPPLYPQWQGAPLPRKRSGPLRWLVVAVVVLLGLLAYAALSGPGAGTVEPGYQNEDYVVPGAGDPVSEIPIPEYESDITTWLEESPLYSETLAAPVRCEIEEIQDVAVLSDAEIQVRMRGFVECLTRVWGPALEDAGYEAYQPTLFVYPSGGEVKTSCGTQPSLNAFYCGADQNLYLAADVLRILPAALGSNPVALDLIIAHEYGHAIQGRTGVFAASAYLGYEAPETEALEVSRRVELQADCFAGGGLHSLSEGMRLGDAEKDAVKEISYEIGDDRLAERFGIELEEGDHGTGDNRRLWADRGLTGEQLSTCNTFVADSSEVR